MRLFVLISISLALLSACAGAPVASSVTAPGQPTGLQGIQNSPPPSVTIKPMITLTPTNDTLATVRADGISAEKTHDASALLILLAGTDVQNTINTSIAMTAFHDQETLTAAPQKTHAVETAAAKTQAAQGTAAALEAMRATQAIEAPTLAVANAKAKAEADNAPVQAWVQAWSPLLSLLVVALFFVCASWVAMVRINHAPAQYHEPVTPNEMDEPLPRVTQVNTHSGTYLSAMQYEFSASPQALLRFWQRVADGRSISYGNFTPQEKGFSRDDFNVLQNELIEFGLALQVNQNEPARGLHLTEAGRQYARKYAHASPTPAGFTPIPGI